MINVIKLLKINDDSKESNEEILWLNLKVADENLHLQYVITLALAWFKLYPTKGCQDLELEFRSRNFNTYLFATEPRRIPGTKLTSINDLNYEPIFECSYSCRSAPHALNELLCHSKSYGENFAKLERSGVISILANCNEEATNQIQKQGDKIFDDNEKNQIQLLSDSKVKLQIVTLSDEQFITDIVNSLQQKTGKEVVRCVCKTNQVGEPIFCLTIDEKIVSKFGYTIDSNNLLKVIQLF